MTFWPMRPLGELIENRDSLRQPVKEADRRHGPYPYYGASGVVDYVDSYLYEGEHLLIAEDGENLRSRSTPIAFLANGRFWVNNHAHVVRGAHGNSTRFLQYAVRAADIDPYLTGAVMPKLTQANLSRMLVVAPSPTEQRAIARILGALDDKIELNRRTNETLEAMARALFQSWFVDFDPVRAKMEGRQPEGMDAETAKLFPSELEESGSGELPRGWTWSALYDCATWINGAAYRDFQFCEAGQGLPIIKIAELKSGVTAQTRFTHTNPGEKYRIRSGDVLFSWSGNPDTSIDTFIWTRGEAWLNQHIFKVLPPTPTDRAFLICLLRSLKPVFADIARNKQTTGLGHVTAGDMKRLQVPSPSAAVRDAFDKLARPVLSAVDSHVLASQALEGLRDTLLPKLLSGELRIPEAEKAVSAVL